MRIEESGCSYQGFRLFTEGESDCHESCDTDWIVHWQRKPSQTASPIDGSLKRHVGIRTLTRPPKIKSRAPETQG